MYKAELRSQDALAKELPEVKLAVTTSPGYWLGRSKVGSALHPNVAAGGKFAGPEGETI